MYRVGLALILLCSCVSVDNTNLLEEYGEHYFSMDCAWTPPDANDGIWWCDQDVTTELITGYILISLRAYDELAICGKDIELNTGYNLHDQLIPYLTRDKFDCITAMETELGNEFDWLWDDELRTLQLIWRYEEEQKTLTLIIEEGEPDHLVSGEVYYKTILKD